MRLLAEFLPYVWSDVHPNSSQGFWQVASRSWTLNGKTIERAGNTTILDTGTTLCLVSDDVVEEIYGTRILSSLCRTLTLRRAGAIEGATFDNQQGGYKYPTNAQIPTVAFAVGDKLYTVSTIL